MVGEVCQGGTGVIGEVWQGGKWCDDGFSEEEMVPKQIFENTSKISKLRVVRIRGVLSLIMRFVLFCFRADKMARNFRTQNCPEMACPDLDTICRTPQSRLLQAFERAISDFALNPSSHQFLANLLNHTSSYLSNLSIIPVPPR